MDRKRTTWAVLAASLAGALFAADGARAAEPSPFVMARDGKAQAVIVVQDGVTNGVRYAANELADFLGRISGARFMVADKPVPGYKTILVGAPYKAAAKEEISIRVKDRNTLEVTGDGPRGTVYAAYDLLETLGVVFVAHDFEYVPTTNVLAIAGDYAKTDAPFMYAMREGWSWVNWYDFKQNLKLRNHMNEGLAKNAGYPELAKEYPLSYNHSIGGPWLSKKNHKDNFKDEWFAYQRATGKRDYSWVCLSNEEMWKTLLAEIGEYLAKHPDAREVSVARGDTLSFCECDKCLALVHEYPDPDGSEVMTAQDILLANRVGRQFARKYPGVRFNFLPYGQRFPANEKLKLEPNVGACSAELWRNHGLPADCNERSASSLAQVCRLADPKCGTYVWDYLANFRDFVIPFPNFRIFGQTAQYYKRLNVRGVYTQHQFCFAGDMSEMKLWLQSKLLWNPDGDVDALIDTYVKAAFGNGARGIKEYLDILEHARLRQRGTWVGCYVNDTSHYLTDDDCVKVFRALDSACNAVRNDPPRRVLANRARLATLAMALYRYNDMIEPAQRLKFKLPPRERIWADWQATIRDSAQNFGSQMTSEDGGSYEKRVALMFEKPAEPTVYPRTSSVIRIGADKLTGGTKMTKQRDPGGTEYAQLKIALSGEADGIWMNPNYSEIGYSAKPEEAGWWYVFATIRVGATVDCDPASAYLGIYQPWIANGVELKKGVEEIVNLAIVGRKGENGWQTICLGKRRIHGDSRIWVMNGVLHPVDFIDVREFTLVDPELVETDTP